MIVPNIVADKLENILDTHKKYPTQRNRAFISGYVAALLDLALLTNAEAKTLLTAIQEHHNGQK